MSLDKKTIYREAAIKIGKGVFAWGKGDDMITWMIFSLDQGVVYGSRKSAVSPC